jgi:CheY-like chemotaxis protein
MNYHTDAQSRPTVLYVEDNPVNAMLMTALFERCSQLRLVVAQSAKHALDLAPGLRPVLLLLDLNLPDCHGSQLLPVLRHLPGYADVPAVAVTADSDFSIADTEFVELWTKPLNLSTVLARLDALTFADSSYQPDSLVHAQPARVAQSHVRG